MKLVSQLQAVSKVFRLDVSVNSLPLVPSLIEGQVVEAIGESCVWPRFYPIDLWQPAAAAAADDAPPPVEPIGGRMRLCVVEARGLDVDEFAGKDFHVQIWHGSMPAQMALGRPSTRRVRDRVYWAIDEDATSTSRHNAGEQGARNGGGGPPPHGGGRSGKADLHLLQRQAGGGSPGAASTSSAGGGGGGGNRPRAADASDADVTGDSDGGAATRGEQLQDLIDAARVARVSIPGVPGERPHAEIHPLKGDVLSFDMEKSFDTLTVRCAEGSSLAHLRPSFHGLLRVYGARVRLGSSGWETKNNSGGQSRHSRIRPRSSAAGALRDDAQQGQREGWRLRHLRRLGARRCAFARPHRHALRIPLPH